MKKPPRKLNAAFFSFRELSLSIVQGLIITLACLGIGYYYLEGGASDTLVRTMIYSTLIMSNLFLTLTNRSFYYSIFTTIQYKNKLIPLILVVSMLILFVSIYFIPVQAIFLFEALSLKDLFLCISAAFAGVIWIEFYKLYKRRIDPHE